MSFERLYRVSFNLMLTLAALALSVDVASDNPYAPLYPLAVAIVSVITFVTVDRTGRGLNREAANFLALASMVPSYLEYRADNTQLVSALGHWLVYLQIIKMFLPKTVEDDWFLFLLALTQAVVGAFQPGEYVGLVLTFWALTALWALGLFHLRREAGRGALEGQAGGVQVLPSPNLRDPYPGLVDASFLASTVHMAVLTLLLGGIMFLLMPRWETRNARRFSPQGMSQHLTGFSDSVQLGQMGQILENEAVVLTVELFNDNGDRATPPSEPLWRGLSMHRYEKGRWYRPSAIRPFDDYSSTPPPPAPGEQRIRQVIKLENNDSDVLFSLRPVHWAEGRDLALNRVDGSLYRQDLRPEQPYDPRMNRNPGRYSYTVISEFDSSEVQPLELRPNRLTLENELLAVPPLIEERLRPLVAKVLEDVSEDTIQRAQALEAFLLGGEYYYSLSMQVVDPSVDPIVDFLFNRKQGHCEYFASALTLMLRTAGIPARLVNGFKGGDWNNLAQVYLVRQKHAHSWVEALVGETEGLRPIWKTLDPTPGQERQASVASLGGVGSRLRFATDYFRYLWVFYVVGFDAARQERLIYGPIKRIFAEAMRGFGLMFTAGRSALDRLLHVPRGQSSFTLGRIVVVLVLIALAAIGLVAVTWLARRAATRLRRARDDGPDLASGVAIYRRLQTILSGFGLARLGPETPREFARRVADAIAVRHAGLAELPSRIVEAFYSVRFGDKPLDQDQLLELELGLDELEAVLKPS